MSALSVRLLGKFSICCDVQPLSGFDARKAQELLAYLLLYRGRPHAREKLATMLSGEVSTAQAQKCLRQALWQLQTGLEVQQTLLQTQVLSMEDGWLRINPRVDLWLDVAAFEQIFILVQGRPGQELDQQQANDLQFAVALYQGDLLEDCYAEWCLFERERLRNMYLAMLDKLMAYCGAQHAYEAGLSYGFAILRYDPASERTYRRMMRLHYLAGNRTAALREYEHCVTALSRELNVMPGKQTVALYQAICWDQGLDTRAPEATPSRQSGTTTVSDTSRSNLLSQLQHLEALLFTTHCQVQQHISTVETLLEPPIDTLSQA